MNFAHIKMQVEELTRAFLSPVNLEELAIHLRFEPRRLKKMARKWSVLNDLDPVIAPLPSLSALNQRFAEYYADLLNTELEWEDVLLNSQKGYWPNQKPNRDPLKFHPLTVGDQMLRGNQAITARQYDTFNAQSSEISSNLYRAHKYRRPLTIPQLRAPRNRGQLSPYEMFLRGRNMK
jgi:hypothetical protein